MTRAQQTDRLEATRRYYDEFAERYDDARGGNVVGGYHDFLDDQELSFLERFAGGRSVLEVGCGTGLLLERMAEFASRAEGIDLSPGMLAHARRRGLTVREASGDALPYPDDAFDVVCSFKVLSHIHHIEETLGEMLRVARRHVVAEFYNRHSLRYLVKRFGPAGAISQATRESEVYTRFDTPAEVQKMLPQGARIVAAKGIRIVTPWAGLMRVPLLRDVMRSAEATLAEGPAARWGGFWVAAITPG